MRPCERKYRRSEIPGGAPSETVGRDVGHLGHTGEAKITTLGEEGGIEDGEEGRPVRFAPVEMPQMAAEARPLIHFNKELREVDQGQPCRDGVFQGLDTLGPFLRLER